MSLTKSALEILADTRIREAGALLDLGHFSGAYYLAGYAVECALKAVIAKNFRSNEIPDKLHVNSIYVHDLAKLVRLAELSPVLADRQREKQRFAENWEFVTAWSEQARYALVDQDHAKSLVEAIQEPENGVLAWIKLHW